MNNGGVYGLDYWAYVEVVACSRSIRHSKLNCSFIQRAAYEHDSLFSYEEICSHRVGRFMRYNVFKVFSKLVFGWLFGFCLFPIKYIPMKVLINIFKIKSFINDL